MNSQELRALQEAYNQVYELDETRTDPRGRPASGPMSVYGGRGQDAGPGGSGNANIDRMDAAQRRVKQTQPKKKGMAADRLFTKYSARQKGMEHGGEEGPGPNAPRRGGRSGRGANTDRGSGNAAARRMREEFEGDLFDFILEHLVAEGYADTNEAALAIMANMSEEWREEIVDEGYKKLPVGKMINQSARHSNPKRVAKMGKVADAHNPDRSQRKEDDNRRTGGRKRDTGRPRSNELQDNW